MHIVAVNQFYAPDEAATAQLLTDLCEDLAAAGNEVTVVASRGGYRGERALVTTEVINGVRVVRPWSTTLGKRTVARRLADYSTYFAGVVQKLAVTRRPSVILALTTPPAVGVACAATSKVRHVPLILWVQDVYPNVAEALGVLRPGGAVSKAVSIIQRFSYHRARYVVCLSQGMADRLIAAGAVCEQVRVIPNWADGNAVRPIAREENTFRRAHDLGNRFVAMYSGNIGIGHDVATFASAARKLAGTRPEIIFVFVGDGSRRAELEQMTAGLSNVRFVGYQRREALGHSLTAADVHLISSREGLSGLIVPSKLYGAMASGRPIAYVGPTQCEIARVVRDEAIGFAASIGDADALSAYLSRLALDRDEANNLGQRARSVFEERYDRRHRTQEWLSLFQEASASAVRPGTRRRGRVPAASGGRVK